MNTGSDIDRVITAIEEQTNKALSRVDKGRVDMNDLSEACIALKSIKALLPGLSEAMEKAPRRKARARGFLKSLGLKGNSDLVVTDLVLTDGCGREAAFTGLNIRYPEGLTVGDELSVAYRPLSNGPSTMRVVESVKRVKPRKGKNPNERK